MKSSRPPAPSRLPDFAPTQIEPVPFDPALPPHWNDLTDDSAPVPLDLLPLPVQAEPTVGHVGRYALKATIGEGGLGRVYTAWDPLLSRNLAIKLLQFKHTDLRRDTLDRLILDEARVVAGLNHPNIVTVYDAGLSDHGVYIAMELMPGCDLRRLLADGWRPDPLRAARLIRRIADALTYAHDKGVIHCDIKPANIFMIDRRKPKVLDFGIARVARREGRSALDGLITGSPHYLAPEQIAGGEVDARTDVYAMGVVLFELLTGRKAFTGRSVRAIAEAVLQGQPVPAKALNAAVPAELSAIAARAMAVDPERRFATPREMAMALRHWQARSPKAGASNAATAASAAATATHPEPQPPDPAAPTRQWPRVVGVAGALAAVAAAAWWWQQAG